ncbi:MAG: bifunctional hydroxymethylpyrimidine kinase/phosphomethylpyrimidine kinase [Desulfobulbaceae bacterium]|jgi:hydroxymethylpyrimidine/phosphomethylpyrimidine kinase|nr:bifunctional hydroxymethylpyrimidine kinase/phosphomethylpyrimidine kinase [Desulfobulbaceae bacterium]
MNPPKQYTRVLTIAGSDSGGGAGIQADLKTFAAHGCYGMSAITAVTAQNTMGVRAIHAIPAAVVRDQIEAVLEDIGADAIKIGMLFSPELIRTVAATLRRYAVKNIVLDPVMAAQSGDRLLLDDALAALRDEMIPLARLITPNLPEAATLLGRDSITGEEMAEAARELAGFGCENVLLKGGHLPGVRRDDALYWGEKNRSIILPGQAVATRNNHGTGCTLSAAIAARLALGQDMETAVRAAKGYVTGALAAGSAYQIGQGHGPTQHFFRFWPT